MTQTSAGYGAAAALYRKAGWNAVLPLPPGQKTPPPDGYTGREGADPSDAQVAAWSVRHPNGNVALRMPDGVIGIDTDAYGEKKGGLTFAAAEGQWGSLPDTWRSTSRPDDAVSGIRFFRVPPGTMLPGQIEAGVSGTRTGDIEIVQRHHRYAVAAPSLHPEGRRYIWFRPDGTQAAEGEVPSPDDLPELPQTWLSSLLAQGGEGDPAALLAALPGGEPCTRMREFRQQALDACQGSSRHDNVSERLLAILRLGERGHPGAPAVVEEVRAAFCQAIAKDRPDGAQEFHRMLVGGARLIARSRTRLSERGCFCGEVPDKGMSDAHLTDVVAMDVLQGRWLWSSALGWLHWDDRRWQPAPTPLVIEAVRQYLLSRYRAATEIVAKLTAGIEELEAHRGMAKVNGNGPPPSHEIEELTQRRANAEQEAKQWYATLAKARIAAISELTRGTVTCDAADLDARPDLLNVENGVVDLTTGSLKPHDPDLLLTKMAPVSYRPGAKHADWDKALGAVPDDAIDWYQERLGQAITGHIPPDDVLVVQKGTGENGKTTLMSGVQAVLGDYFVLASERVLIADANAHPTELMDLRGARLALIEETPEERKLSISRLKKVVGNPAITARRIRQDSVTFPTTHALFVSTNYLPIVEETDHGTWRRLACLCFPYVFRKPGQALNGPNERPGDPDLRQRLKEGRSGQHEAILAWLVEGARRWYAARRRMSLPPARIVNDTRTWQVHSDLFLTYVDEQLVYDFDRHVMSSELLEHFNSWLRERKQQEWGNRTFIRRLDEHHEMAAHQVLKKVLRHNPKTLSRPPGRAETPTPRQYNAWRGLRFRTESDPLSPADEDRSGDEAAAVATANARRPVHGTSRAVDPEQPSQPSHPATIWSAGPNGSDVQVTHPSHHSIPSANSNQAGVMAVMASKVDAENDPRARVHVSGHPNEPSQPSQADAGRPLGTEPPAPGEDAATGAAPGCRHSAVELGDGLIRCLDCGAARSAGQPWPAQPRTTFGDEAVGHDAS